MAQAQLKRRVRFPCVVCDKACGVGTIECMQCTCWVHVKCVPLTTTQLREFSVAGVQFLCRRCACDVTGSVFNYEASIARSVKHIISVANFVAVLTGKKLGSNQDIFVIWSRNRCIVILYH